MPHTHLQMLPIGTCVTKNRGAWAACVMQRLGLQVLRKRLGIKCHTGAVHHQPASDSQNPCFQSGGGLAQRVPLAVRQSTPKLELD